MPTYWTQTLIPTLREVPAEAEVPSHQLMLRAGLIRKVGSGIYDYLPLGLRALHKAMNIIREEMNALGAAEVLLPALQPMVLWETTKRRAAYGENLFVVKDRHEREQALGPTHEEVVTEMFSGCVESYKQLPLIVYQIQTKFRDEFRPRFGVLRSREFQMKDAYSFHLELDGDDGLRATYQKMYEAYERIFERCGLPYRVVQAEAGPIGGSASHEFMVPCETGEDIILQSDKLDDKGNPNYAANVERADIGDRPFHFDHEPAGKLKRVKTPQCKTVEDVATYLGAPKTQVLKTMIFEASLLQADKIEEQHEFQAKHTPSPRAGIPERFYLLAVVRGDHDVNPHKLLSIVKEKINANIHTVEIMEEHEAIRHDFTIGYLGPQVRIDHPLTRLVVDIDAVQGGDYIVGANLQDYHLQHFNWKRDFIEQMDDQPPVVADIREAMAGDPSPVNDGGTLQLSRGIELGHIFQLGDKYTRALEVKVVDQQNQSKTPIMGCYGIGVNRILASAIEREGGRDDHGIIWPMHLAPYHVIIDPVKMDPGSDVEKTVQHLAGELEAKGVEVLIDDRDERPGVKFKDADLVGIPLRIVVSEKTLADAEVELKARDGSMGEKGKRVAIDAVVDEIAILVHG